MGKRTDGLVSMVMMIRFSSTRNFIDGFHSASREFSHALRRNPHTSLCSGEANALCALSGNTRTKKQKDETGSRKSLPFKTVAVCGETKREAEKVETRREEKIFSERKFSL